tara:strand:- start:254 stop:628 length:375 start_codon:yes stop_codon:yes gene_type:complete
MSTQQNPTLIPGFEDIMRHIRQQEDQIKKLEKTNKEQQEKMTKLWHEIEDLREVESLLQPFENTETFRMKVEEMKKENQELEEKITCLESDSYNEVSQAEYDELEAEYDELKEENKKLKKMYLE